MNPRRWTAEVYRADRKQIGVRRPGDGRRQSDPFADPGCLYIIGPDEARALGEALIAAADAVAPRARRYFVHDGEGYDSSYASPDEARRAAENALDRWRADATSDGWAEEVRSVAWGEVIERAEAVLDEHAEDDEERGVDYRLANCRVPVVAAVPRVPAPCPGCVGDLAGLVDAVCPTCRVALTVAFGGEHVR